MAKSTSWITIEEDKLHTPASDTAKATKAKKGGQPPMKNKLFWGASFVILIVVTFALLAPAQFNELIKGSLFDAIGEDAGDLAISPMTLLGGADADDISELIGEVMEAVPEEVMEAVEEIFQSEPVVQAAEEAVSIAVEPISQPETIDIEPVGPGAEACGDDIDCFLEHLKDCSLATASYEYQVMGQNLGTDLSLTGADGDDCVINMVFTKSPPLIGLKGKTAECKLEKGEYTESSLQSKLGDPDEALSNCTGSAIDIIEQFAAFLGSAPKADPKDDLIAELSEQLSQLQSQKELQDAALQDLTQIVQDQLQNGRPAAPVTLPTGLPPANIPTSITSTTGIGQPGVVSPLFRSNPYVVSISPEQVLAQNKAGGVQYVAQATSPVYQPSYTAPQVAQTPETGPETILIAFLVSFLALMGWKFTRIFA